MSFLTDYEAFFGLRWFSLASEIPKYISAAPRKMSTNGARIPQMPLYRAPQRKPWLDTSAAKNIMPPISRTVPIRVYLSLKEVKLSLHLTIIG